MRQFEQAESAIRSSDRNVAFFLNSLRYGGAERMTLNLIHALVVQHVPVDLVLAQVEGELLDQLPPQVRLFDLNCRRVRGAVGGLVQYLRRERPFGLVARVDHVNVVSSLASALAGGQTRLIVTAANRCLTFPDSATISPLRAALRRRALLPMMRWAYRRADAVVAVSDGIGDEFREVLRLAPERIRVIRNPVITPHISRLAREAPPHPWLEDPSVPVLVAVGRLVWEKDHATLLKSFSLLLKRLNKVENRQARLLLLGEGPLRPELERLRRSLGLDAVCDLPGYCPNPYAAMARADLLVLSSRSEGSPNVLAEALACGCPVVSTDCPSGPREILAGGRFGLLAPVGDPHGLAASMHQALEKSWDRADLQSRAADYSSQTSASRYLDALGYPVAWRGTLTSDVPGRNQRDEAA